jgi:hypothetical protein
MYGNIGAGSRVITYSQVLGDRLVVSSPDRILQVEAGLAGVGTLGILPVDSRYLAAAGRGSIEMEAQSYNVCVFGGGTCGVDIQAYVGSASDLLLYRFESDWIPVDRQHREGNYIRVAAARPGIYCLGRNPAPAPGGLSISQVAPNPFTDRCSFVIEAPGEHRVQVQIFDVRGRLVRRVFDGAASAPVEIWWDGTDRSGRRVAGGIYFVNARAGSTAGTRKIIVAR